MKTLHIEMRINIRAINKTDISTILMVSTCETPVGFIHIEESLCHDTPDRLTPFTPECILPEVNCQGCAVRALLAYRFCLPEDAVEIAETICGPADVLAAMLAGLRHSNPSTH
jgi:hypothetical protein